MKEYTKEKLLAKVNKNSIFYKIKQFFNSLFLKNKPINVTENNTIIRADEDRRNLFIEDIKKIEDEETALLKLQKRYRSGEIKEEDLTDNQIKSLCELYDKQIADLKKVNLQKKQKILSIRKKT